MTQLYKTWQDNPRWAQTKRLHTREDVEKLQPSIIVEHTVAKLGAEKFWDDMMKPDAVRALGALTGAQAVNMVRAGLKAIYVSGWQVAADANQSGETYPDQSLYPSNSVPQLVKRIQKALLRADQVEKSDPTANINWLTPIIADAEAGFGGPLHAFELMKSMIEAGASGVHFEDQLASEKKCGHLGGKVLIPTQQFIRTLRAARLAADVCQVPSVIIARTDAHAAKLITSDIDDYDKPFLTGERTPEGYHRIKAGLNSAIARGLAYSLWADVIWFETSTPNIDEAAEFAEAIHSRYPGKPLAYNCSPSFNWEKHLDEKSIASFQKDLESLGYKFQFITLAGWHLLNFHTYDLARNYKATGMSAYAHLQHQEFKNEASGYTATRHQREVGTGYFDLVLNTVTEGESSTSAMSESTETEQFQTSTSHSTSTHL